MEALSPTLVCFDFFHLTGLPVYRLKGSCLDTTPLRPNGSSMNKFRAVFYRSGAPNKTLAEQMEVRVHKKAMG
jgi:hypothetical protein